jgi:hypothetical protein
MTHSRLFFQTFFLFLAFGLMASSSFAGIKTVVLVPPSIKTTEVDTSKKCSTMILVNGREISCFVEEMGIEVVKYRKCDNPTGSIYVMYKKDISLIKYPNGTTEFVKVETTQIIKGVNQSSDTSEDDRKLNVPVTLGFILAIVSLFLPLTIGIIGEVLALILSIVGLSAIGQNSNEMKGKGLGIAAIIISLVVLLLLAAVKL